MNLHRLHVSASSPASSPPASPVVTYRIEGHRKPHALASALYLLVCLTLLVLFANAIIPQMADAAPFSGEIVLGFHDRYGPTSSVHSGIDVALAEGSALYAPVAGTVTYMGQVPAAAGVGNKVTALTITTALGHQVTLNPCANTTVSKNDAVEKGQAIGRLSAVGDPSSDQSHVHLSLRVEGIYRDPSRLIDASLDPDARVRETTDTPRTSTSPTATGSQSTMQAPPFPKPEPFPTIAPHSSLFQEDAFMPASEPAASPASAPQMEMAPQSAPIPAVDSEPAPSPATSPMGGAASPAAESATLPSVAAEQGSTAHPLSIAEIPGVDVADFLEETAVTAARAMAPAQEGGVVRTSPFVSWMQTLTTAQIAAALFAIGIVLPAAAIGIMTVLGRSGVSLKLDTQLFATREES